MSEKNAMIEAPCINIFLDTNFVPSLLLNIEKDTFALNISGKEFLEVENSISLIEIPPFILLLPEAVFGTYTISVFLPLVEH